MNKKVSQITRPLIYRPVSVYFIMFFTPIHGVLIPFRFRSMLLSETEFRFVSDLCAHLISDSIDSSPVFNEVLFT